MNPEERRIRNQIADEIAKKFGQLGPYKMVCDWLRATGKGEA